MHRINKIIPPFFSAYHPHKSPCSLANTLVVDNQLPGTYGTQIPAALSGILAKLLSQLLAKGYSDRCWMAVDARLMHSVSKFFDRKTSSFAGILMNKYQSTIENTLC